MKIKWIDKHWGYKYYEIVKKIYQIVMLITLISSTYSLIRNLPTPPSIVFVILAIMIFIFSFGHRLYYVKVVYPCENRGKKVLDEIRKIDPCMW